MPGDLLSLYSADFCRLRCCISLDWGVSLSLLFTEPFSFSSPNAEDQKQRENWGVSYTMYKMCLLKCHFFFYTS